MTIVSDIVERLEGITKWQKKFLLKLFVAILATHSRINFLNLSRHSSVHEKTYRRGFRRQFDFARFNEAVMQSGMAVQSDKAFAQDASFSAKSGKKTFGLDKFWNGCVSRTEKGLEVSLLALVDVQRKQAFALSAEQTPALPDLQATDKSASRMDFYLQHLQRAAGYFPQGVKYGLFDGFYGKQKFVAGVVDLGFEVVSKLRCDADLKYLFAGEQKKRGRKRQYDGKVQFNELWRFEQVEKGEEEEEAMTLYSQVVWSVRLKRKVRVVVVVNHLEEQKRRYVVLFSTDLRLAARQMLAYYRARFSMEYIFRDAKQFAGFSDCQARTKEALHFHFNASVATVNLARLLAQKEAQEKEKMVFSMASIKQRCFNEQLLERFISKLELDRNLIKTHPQFESLRNYAVIAP